MNPSVLYEVSEGGLQNVLFDPCAPLEAGLMTLVAIIGCLVDGRCRHIATPRQSIQAAAELSSSSCGLESSHKMLARWTCLLIGREYCPVAYELNELRL